MLLLGRVTRLWHQSPIGPPERSRDRRAATTFVDGVSQRFGTWERHENSGWRGRDLWRRRRSGEGRGARGLSWNVKGGRFDGRWCVVSVSRSRCARPTDERGWTLCALLIILSALSCPESNGTPLQMTRRSQGPLLECSLIKGGSSGSMVKKASAVPPPWAPVSRPSRRHSNNYYRIHPIRYGTLRPAWRLQGLCAPLSANCTNPLCSGSFLTMPSIISWTMTSTLSSTNRRFMGRSGPGLSLDIDRCQSLLGWVADLQPLRR